MAKKTLGNEFANILAQIPQTSHDLVAFTEKYTCSVEQLRSDSTMSNSEKMRHLKREIQNAGMKVYHPHELPESISEALYDLSFHAY